MCDITLITLIGTKCYKDVPYEVLKAVETLLDSFDISSTEEFEYVCEGADIWSVIWIVWSASLVNVSMKQKQL